jgi:hypothetical protein
MKPKHTQGPLITIKHEKGIYLIGQQLAKNSLELGDITGKAFSKADAVLYATSPELLSACEAAYTMIGEYLLEIGQESGEANDVHAQLWSAINNATGRES